MKIITVETGSLEENAYIVYADDAKEAVVIDPGDDAPDIINALGKEGLGVSWILLTHGHFDHTGAVNELKKKYNARVAVHELDEWRLKETGGMKAMFSDGADKVIDADRLLHDGDVVDAASLQFQVMHTPGHSAGSVCFLVEDAMFSGDTLFAQTVGRTDFPDSSWAQMQDSLKKICGLPKNYDIYPGHGPATTLEEEKRVNPFLRG